jgi:tetratricopeptide (TPR) repeat protein
MLLSRAEQQMAASRLIEPAGDNAYQKYHYILQYFDPRNEQAREGLKKIADRLEKQALAKQQQKLLEESLQLTEQGLKIDPKHKGLRALRKEISQQLEQKRRRREVARLLAKAEQQLAASHLMEPADDNAYQSYRSVLKLDPHNQQAQAGMQEIANRIEQQARAKQRQEQYKQGLEMIAQGLMAAPKHSGLLALQKELAQQLEEKCRQQVVCLLAQAKQQMEEAHLTEPAGDNAYESYRAVLSLDPENDQALAGLRAIGRQFEKLARRAEQQGQLKEALKLITQGLEVIPDDQSLLQLRTSIAQQLKPPTSKSTSVLNFSVAWFIYLAGVALIVALIYKVTKARLHHIVFQKSEQKRDASARAEVQAQIEAQASQQKKQEQEQRQREVARLLIQAEQQVKASQLIEPADDNANASYRKVLELDPDNTQAKAGLGHIAGHFEQLARQRQAEELFQESLAAAEQGLRVLPEHAGLQALRKEVRTKIDELARQRQETIYLPAPSTTTLESLEASSSRNSSNYIEQSIILEYPQDSRQPTLPDVALAVTQCANPSLVGTKVPIAHVPFRVGRADDVDLPIGGDQGVSREHIVIDYESGKFTICDAGSHNGTYVNGKRLQVNRAEPLFFNDKIHLGPATIITFVYHGLQELPDLTGTRLKDYVLTERLHVSLKAAVYAAKDQKLPRRTVAVKVLSPELATYTGYMEQFRCEVDTAAGLRHAHICKVHEFGEASVAWEGNESRQISYLCMDLMEGGTLTDRIAEDQPIPLEQIVDWLQKLGDALDYAHSRDVIHSGIKPGSVVFDGENNIFLTDFAVASTAYDANRHLIIGAPDFISPEQWEGQPSTPAADQYALAVIAYLLVTGSLPYVGLENPDVRKQQFTRGPTPAHEEATRNGRKAVPRPVSQVLERAMAIKPDNRYPSVGKFVHAFRLAVDQGAQPPRVFICYERAASAGWAVLFSKELDKVHGISVFVDTQVPDNAVRFPQRLQHAIENCDVFVCMFAC